MPQLNYAQNIERIPNTSISFVADILSFFPINIYDNISWNNINLIASFADSAATRNWSFRIGLYSLNGSSLSLENSVSVNRTFATSAAARNEWVTMNNTSATQNITPGTWFLGIVISTGQNNNMSLIGHAITEVPTAAFSGRFIGGGMTVTTAAPPTSYATSDLDRAGTDALSVPYMLLTA
jgi:hypothetical protein